MNTIKKPHRKTKAAAAILCVLAILGILLIPVFTRTHASAEDTQPTASENYPDISGYWYTSSTPQMPAKIGSQYYQPNNNEGYNQITLGLAFNGAGSWLIKLYFSTNPSAGQVTEENSFGYYETTVNNAITSISWYLPDLNIIQEGSNKPLEFVTGYFYVQATPTATAGSASTAFVSYILQSRYGEDFSSGYEYGYSAGYNNGESKGYEDGFAEGEKSLNGSGYQTGYQDGYNKGFAKGAEENNNFLALATAVVDAPVTVFTDMLDVEILGFNLSSLLIALLSVALIVKIISLFTKGGG